MNKTLEEQSRVINAFFDVGTHKCLAKLRMDILELTVQALEAQKLEIIETIKNTNRDTYEGDPGYDLAKEDAITNIKKL